MNQDSLTLCHVANLMQTVPGGHEGNGNSRRFFVTQAGGFVHRDQRKGSNERGHAAGCDGDHVVANCEPAYFRAHRAHDARAFHSEHGDFERQGAQSIHDIQEIQARCANADFDFARLGCAPGHRSQFELIKHAALRNCQLHRLTIVVVTSRLQKTRSRCTALETRHVALAIAEGHLILGVSPAQLFVKNPASILHIGKAASRVKIHSHGAQLRKLQSYYLAQAPNRGLLHIEPGIARADTLRLLRYQPDAGRSAFGMRECL